VQAVRTSFPEAADGVDAFIRSRGFDDSSHHEWLERFSQLTTDAIKRQDLQTARAHLNLLSRVLAAGGEEVTKCIDVSYVEPLMWDLKDESLKRQGWSIIPANLRSLYSAMWGERGFMKGKNEA